MSIIPTDNAVSAIAGGVGSAALLLVVTALTLFCVLILRKIHSTTQSKLYSRCFFFCKFISLSESSDHKLKVPQI